MKLVFSFHFCVFWESILGYHAYIVRLETAVHAELSQRYICLRKSCVHGVDGKLPLVALSKLLDLDLQQYHLFFTPSSLNVDTIFLGRICDILSWDGLVKVNSFACAKYSKFVCM